MDQAGRKRGRPPKPENERKRANLTFRVRDHLRSDLERLASEQGHSVSEEIEYRLERSFIEDILVYGEHSPPHIRQAIQAIARVLSSLESLTGRKVLGPDGDPWLHEQAWAALNLWFAATRPPGKTDPPKKLPPDPYLKKPPDIPIEIIGEAVMALRLRDDALGTPTQAEVLEALQKLISRSGKEDK